MGDKNAQLVLIATLLRNKLKIGVAHLITHVQTCLATNQVDARDLFTDTAAILN